MATQVYTPNVGIGAIRGWCLKYVDDAGSSTQRSPNARTALDKEINAGRIRFDTPPIGLWVVGFLDMRTGVYAADDHVYLMKYLGDGKYDLRDSETNSGQRKPYSSIAELLGWFGNYSPVYAGWSTECDSRKYVELKGDKNMVRETVNWIYRGMLNREPTEAELKQWVGGDALLLSRLLANDKQNETIRWKATTYDQAVKDAFEKGKAEGDSDNFIETKVYIKK